MKTPHEKQIEAYDETIAELNREVARLKSLMEAQKILLDFNRLKIKRIDSIVNEKIRI